VSHTSDAYADLKVLKACIDTDTAPTFTVINSVWRWFLDVEFTLPIPVLDMPEASRETITRDVVTEMADIFADFDAKASSDPDFDPNSDSKVHTLNALWRELAGLYAPLLNSSVGTLPPEVLDMVYPQAIGHLAVSSGMDLDEAVDRVKNDPVLRMMMRRDGLDPDMALTRFDPNFDPDEFL